MPLLGERRAKLMVCWPMMPMRDLPALLCCLQKGAIPVWSLKYCPSPSLAGACPSLEEKREMWRSSVVQSELPGRLWPA